MWEREEEDKVKARGDRNRSSEEEWNIILAEERGLICPIISYHYWNDFILL